MNIKKYKIIGVFAVFLLCFLFHFMYEWIPNIITSLFFPVNESIWEHMKLLFIPYVFYLIIEYFILHKKENNFYIQLFFVPIIGILIYLTIFLPIYNIIGENMFVSLTILFITIVIEEFISYKLATYEEIKYQGVIGIVGVFPIFNIFVYLTYFPNKTYLFYDTVKHIYGIPINK